MAIPVQQYQTLSLEQVNPLGYAISQLPGVIDRAKNQYNSMQQQKLQDSINAIKFKYLEPGLKADLALKQAEAKKYEALASQPFGGETLPGVAGQALAIESIGKRYGYDSPVYKRALDAFNLDQSSQRQNMEYQGALTKSMPERYLTPLGRGFIEEARVNSGQSPTGQNWGDLLKVAGSKNKELSPYNPEEIQNSYELLRKKVITDPDARKRNLYATNVEKTLDRINPDTLTQYAGFGGALSKAFQAGKAPFHAESKKYHSYLKTIQDVKLLRSQVRQFYGESIQPQVAHDLEELVNPATWENNPELAKDMFNEVKEVLASEMKTYRDALKSTSVYSSNNENKKSSRLKYNPDTGDFE